jgi:fatty-acyl-CoA synthase
VRPPAALTFLRALRRTGALHPRPVRSSLHLLLDVLRHGPSLYALVRWQARRRPDAPAVVWGDLHLGYGALLDRADALAARLPTRSRHGAVGVLDGDPLLTLLALLACGRLGCRVLPLSSRLGPQAVRAVQDRERLGILLCPDALLAAYPDAIPLRLDGPPAPRPARRGRARAGQLGLLTSGSTGRPRVIRRPGRGPALATLAALLDTLPLRAGMGAVLPLPLSHGHGLAFLGTCLLLGARLRLLQAPTPGQLWGALHEPGAEVVTLVPTQLHRLMSTPWPRPAGLHGVLCGSGPLDPDLARRTLAHLGPVLFNQYGTTETGPLALATPADLLAAPGSVGRVLPGLPLSVLEGAVTLRTAGGLLHTGDLGHLDGQGRLWLRGRVDHLIVTGGENLNPETLEARLRAWPYVQDCAVQGLPDAEYGQRLRAFVVLDDPADLARFQADCRAQLPRAHRPREVHVVPALPRTDAGKLLRGDLERLLPTPDAPVRGAGRAARSPA